MFGNNFHIQLKYKMANHNNFYIMFECSIENHNATKKILNTNIYQLLFFFLLVYDFFFYCVSKRIRFFKKFKIIYVIFLNVVKQTLKQNGKKCNQM